MQHLTAGDLIAIVLVSAIDAASASQASACGAKCFYVNQPRRRQHLTPLDAPTRCRCLLLARSGTAVNYAVAGLTRDRLDNMMRLLCPFFCW